MVEKQTSRNSLFLLGVPITPATLTEAIVLILSALEEKREESDANLIVTINVDFIAKSVGLRSKQPYDEEFLRILRGSMLSFADGMPLVWLSKLLLSPLPERVTGQDLLVPLLQELARQKAKIAIIGGREEELPQLVEQLKRISPAWSLTPIFSPYVHLQGEEALFSWEEDLAICEALSKEEVNFLFLALGAPKQELWFRRNQGRLTVKMAIGVGGSFERWQGVVKRAPESLQKWGLEWCYRLIQEPSRLWRRYLIDGIKLAYLATPLLIFYSLQRGFRTLFLHEKKPPSSRLFISEESTITRVKAGTHLTLETLARFQAECSDLFDHEAILLDLRELRIIDLYGMGALFSLVMEAKKEGKRLVIFGLTWEMQQLFRLNRLIDLVAAHLIDSEEELIFALAVRSKVFYSTSATENEIEIAFLGELTGVPKVAFLEETVEKICYGKSVILDLALVGKIDRVYGYLFMKLQLEKERENLRCIVAAKSPQVEALFDQIL